MRMSILLVATVLIALACEDPATAPSDPISEPAPPVPRQPGQLPGLGVHPRDIQKVFEEAGFTFELGQTLDRFGSLEGYLTSRSNAKLSLAPSTDVLTWATLSMNWPEDTDTWGRSQKIGYVLKLVELATPHWKGAREWARINLPLILEPDGSASITHGNYHVRMGYFHRTDHPDRLQVDIQFISATCQDAFDAEWYIFKGDAGDGWGYPEKYVPLEPDPDGDGIVCEEWLSSHLTRE